ncbi:hypothetical protein NIES2109_02890 [Nostoc sp. HK-01]|nr:hypothetical protein NIES2109_02890 [Nostoc sp. HK-01]
MIEECFHICTLEITLAAMMFAINKKIPQWWQPPGELVIRVHLPINCSVCDRPQPDKIFRFWQWRQKKSPVGVNQLGELVIRVHLPINCSVCDRPQPDKIFSFWQWSQKKSPSRCKPARGISYQGASTN